MAVPAFQINQYTATLGITGHIDISLRDSIGNISTFGFNVITKADGSVVGGWTAENNLLSNPALINQSGCNEVDSATLQRTVNFLNQQVEQAGAFGSPGYAFAGNNCVDGVQQTLGRLGQAAQAVDYMTPTTDSVYYYALLRSTGTALKTPSGIPVNNLITAVGEITQFVGQSISGVLGFLGSSSDPNDNGTPNNVTTGVIVITASKSTGTASIDYSQQGILKIYDSSGNVIGQQQVTGSPTFVDQNIVDAMSDQLTDFANEYDFYD